MKSKELLEDFTAYCEAHPEFRFWQALRNWSQYGYIFVGNLVGMQDFSKMAKEFPMMNDTFYWERRRNDF